MYVFGSLMITAKVCSDVLTNVMSTNGISMHCQDPKQIKKFILTINLFYTEDTIERKSNCCFLTQR